MQENHLPISHFALQALQGLAWGLAARQLHDPLRKPEAIDSLPETLPEGAYTAVSDLFSQPDADIDLVGKADAIVDQFPDLEDLREYLMDLCALRIIEVGSEQEGEEFLEGKNWEQVEAKMEARGTELLNLLIYLRDCRENEIEPTLVDFLQEFLMVSDEDFQEELAIYEDLIRHQDLVDGSLKQLIQTGNNLRDPEMQEIFTPTMLFFKGRLSGSSKLMLHLLNGSRIPEVHAAIYLLLVGFYRADAASSQ
ncbi:MAG: hypothetical protein AAGN35_03835 [Bacteroidota bacterium]